MLLPHLLLAALAAAPQLGGPAPVREVAIDLAAHPAFDWRAADLDVVRRPAPDAPVLHVLADDAELARLAGLGVRWEVVHADLVAHYASRLDLAEATAAPAHGAWLAPPFGSGSMGGYYTWSEVVSVLDQVAAAYPAIVAPKQSLGLSVEGRALWALKVSDQPALDEDEPEVRFDALHHAREPQSMQATLWMLLWLVEGYGTDPLATWLVDERELWFVPAVNPDGYVYNESIAPGGGGLWRKNRRWNGGSVYGVDLNRNYPYQWGYDSLGSSGSIDSETYRGPSPASEPETQAMVAFLATRDFATALSSHTYSDLWLFAYGYDDVLPANLAEYDEVSKLQTLVNGYTWGTVIDVLYPANGAMNDHEHATHDTMSWTPEIGGAADGFWPPTERIVPLAEENLLAFQRTALAAGAWAHLSGVQSVPLGDGDAFAEPGELVELHVEVRNSGRDGTAGAVQVGVTSDDAAVVSGTSDLGPIASFATADTGATPLVVQLPADAVPGTAAKVSLHLSWDGMLTKVDSYFLVGERRPFLVEDVEIDLGWSAGVPGDTATTGLWELADPIGTWSGSDPVNPSEAAPGAGALCFVTGNAGGDAGTDDVDDGRTTLLSPRFDLSDAGPAVLSYQRWWADLTTSDDVLEVALSNDDGATWVVVEEVAATQSEWTTREVLVEDLLPATDAMRLRLVASDDPNNSLVEAALDDVRIDVFADAPLLGVWGSTEASAAVALHVSTPEPGASYTVFASQTPASLVLPGVAGTIELDPATALPFVWGATGADGLGRTVHLLPALAGVTLHVQAVVVDAGGISVTNAATLSIE